MSKAISTLCLILFPFITYAQEKTYYLGIGSANVMDTYLSPYSYKGFGMSVTREVQYSHTLHTLSFSASSIENKAGNVDAYSGDIRYGIAHQFDIYQADNLTVKAGPMGTMMLGCAYNTRNGNNPANVHSSLMAGASARIDYDLHICGRSFPLQYVIDFPLIGIAYSPNYGQAYYEEFVLGNSDHNIVFAYTGNTPSLRQRLTVAFPAGKHQLRVGYLGQYDQSSYNNLRYHSYSHQFVIGLTM